MWRPLSHGRVPGQAARNSVVDLTDEPEQPAGVAPSDPRILEYSLRASPRHGAYAGLGFHYFVVDMYVCEKY